MHRSHSWSSTSKRAGCSIARWWCSRASSAATPSPKARWAKRSRDQADTPDVMSAPEHYGMHRHFTAAGSVVLFGGGIKKGTLYGKTADERPCTTIENPVPVEDLHATIYHALGIAPTTVRTSPRSGRCMSQMTVRDNRFASCSRGVRR